MTIHDYTCTISDLRLRHLFWGISVYVCLRPLTITCSMSRTIRLYPSTVHVCADVRWLRPSSASEPAARSGSAVSSLPLWEPGSIRPVVPASRSRLPGASGSWRGARKWCSPSLILWQWREAKRRSLLLAPSRLTPLKCKDLSV